ncbi:MAG: hypothetical protein A2X49_13240 [Lentisphaerae bacterium GWF2_52_8]|nr:MAG: hypothetical protein A2X49_13240 [Lentisphaerae bacterium GWF2_52_8]
MKKSILIKNGTIVDPKANNVFHGDIRIEGALIASVAKSIAPRKSDRLIDAAGNLVMPGLVDIHVHISHCPDGHQMLAKAGVTSTLDVSGMPNDMLGGFAKAACGLSVAFLYPLIPGSTINGKNPSKNELRKAFDYALNNGALGVKIAGGHYPLTPQATQAAIEIAREKRAWIAVHAGSTETPSDICGFEELVQLAGSNPVQLVHVNSFCRGTVEDPLKEAVRALDSIKSVPNCRSESYLATINGTSGALAPDGIPKSGVTRRCLTQGGFPMNLEGMKKAILVGWAKVHHHDIEKREIILLDPEDGLKSYLKNKTNVMQSFPVNSPVSAIPIALAKNEKGSFVVDALATDGGAIPRNVTLKQGLCLVAYGALTLPEFARKACMIPASIMGLSNKGHLSPGAFADIIIVDQDAASLKLSISEGQVIVKNGKVIGKGGQFISTERANEFLKGNSLTPVNVTPKWLKH